MTCPCATSQKSFLFPLPPRALLFFLFNWLGKEIGSCDVNKENESLPKVEPAVRGSDALIKWLSSKVDRSQSKRERASELRGTGWEENGCQN